MREAAISIVGRLTLVNPAYIMPSLRKTLLQLLTELEYSNVPRNKEESAILLGLLVAASQTLIKPYVDPMITVLLPKARDPHSAVATTILRAIGELANVGGADMLPYVHRLMPILIDALQDLGSQSKREAALRTLGQLASSSGYVIDPYLDYPPLLGILVGIVRAEPTGSLRRETIKLMGILGALDPYKHQEVLDRSPESSSAAETERVTDVSLMVGGLMPSHEDYYPQVVFNALIAIIRDSSLANHHSAVIDAIMNIFKTLGLKCVSFLPTIVPAFISVIRAASPGRLELYFNQLSILVTIVRQHIRTFLPNILDLIRDYWHALHGTILQLIEAISKALEGEFKVYLAQLLPLMIQVLEGDALSMRLSPEKVLHTFLVFGSSGEEYMHLIIPAIVRVFEKLQHPLPLRRHAIETIGKLSRQVNISDFASRIVQPLTRVLYTGEATLKQTALDTLCALIFQLGRDFIHYIPLVNKVRFRDRFGSGPGPGPFFFLFPNPCRGEPLDLFLPRPRPWSRIKFSIRITRSWCPSYRSGSHCRKI